MAGARHRVEDIPLPDCVRDAVPSVLPVQTPLEQNRNQDQNRNRGQDRAPSFSPSERIGRVETPRGDDMTSGTR